LQIINLANIYLKALCDKLHIPVVFHLVHLS